MDETLLSNENDTNVTKEIEACLNLENEESKEAYLKTHMINAISQNLKDIINDNSCYESYISKDKFYLTCLPDISLNDYIKRLVKYTNMNISTLINAIIYIDTFCEKNNYILCMNNIYLILLSAFLLSIKFNEDLMVNLKTYSQIAGVSPDILQNLESSFYFNLHFSLFVKEDLYQSYYDYFSNFGFPFSKKEKEI